MSSTIVESENANILASKDIVGNLSGEPKLTRDAVEALGNRVSMTDSDESVGLQLFCYVKCGPDDESLVSQCRGVVFNGQNIVMQAFPYTIEYGHTEMDEIKKNINTDFENCHIFDAYEGTLIRMFYYGRWFTSTHRKLNAFRSKWSSKESFGTTFKRALESEVENNEDLRKSLPETGECLLERFQTILDPEKQYMFLVLHNEENRIVCASPVRPTVFHVGNFVNSKLVMTEDINIPHPRKHSFQNIDSLVDYVGNVNIREMQGVIIFSPNNKQYKILNKEYLEFFKVRGNEPSIKYRYLQVRMDKYLCNTLYNLYPNTSSKFEEYENILYLIAQNIYSSYVARYIKKKWVTVAIEEFTVVRKCHSFHEKDRKQNRVTLNKVIEVLNEQTPTNLNKMIRRFQMEKDRPQQSTQRLSGQNDYKKRETRDQEPQE